MIIDTDLLAIRNDGLVRALDIMTEKLNTRTYDLRMATLKVQNLEMALAFLRSERVSDQRFQKPDLPVAVGRPLTSHLDFQARSTQSRNCGLFSDPSNESFGCAILR